MNLESRTRNPEIRNPEYRNPRMPCAREWRAGNGAAGIREGGDIKT